MTSLNTWRVTSYAGVLQPPQKRHLTSPVLKFSVGGESLSWNYHYVLYFVLFLRYHYSRDRILSCVHIWSDIYASSAFVMSCYYEEKQDETFSCDSMFTCQPRVDQNFWTEEKLYAFLSVYLSIYLHNSYLDLDSKNCIISIICCILERETVLLQVWQDNSTF